MNATKCWNGEWLSLATSQELSLKRTLSSGQSFSWQQFSDDQPTASNSAIWGNVLSGIPILLRERNGMLFKCLCKSTIIGTEAFEIFISICLFTQFMTISETNKLKFYDKLLFCLLQLYNLKSNF
jgi:hypothetical protein